MSNSKGFKKLNNYKFEEYIVEQAQKLFMLNLNDIKERKIIIEAWNKTADITSEPCLGCFFMDDNPKNIAITGYNFKNLSLILLPKSRNSFYKEYIKLMNNDNLVVLFCSIDIDTFISYLNGNTTMKIPEDYSYSLVGYKPNQP